MAQILVVDDDLEVRLALRTMLESAGHQVAEAADGAAAESADAERPAEIIILDVHMPERDGIETLRSLRKRGREAKIVMIGGGCSLCRGDFLPMARRLGADATISKPIDRDMLLRALTGLLPEPNAA